MGMKLIMEQDAIEQAVETYVREMIPGLADGTIVRMDLSATRGPAGFTAEVRLMSEQEAAQPEPEKAAPDTTTKRAAPVENEIGEGPAEVAEEATTEQPVTEEPKPKRAYNRKVQVSGTKSLGLTEPQKTDMEISPAQVESRDGEIETPATEEVEAEQVADTAPVAEETTVDPVEEPSPVDVQVESEAAAEVAVEETPAPARKSLFANLNKG